MLPHSLGAVTKWAVLGGSSGAGVDGAEARDPGVTVSAPCCSLAASAICFIFCKFSSASATFSSALVTFASAAATSFSFRAAFAASAAAFAAAAAR